MKGDMSSFKELRIAEDFMKMPSPRLKTVMMPGSLISPMEQDYDIFCRKQKNIRKQ